MDGWTSGGKDRWVDGQICIDHYSYVNFFPARSSKEPLLTSTPSELLLLLIIRCLFAPQMLGVLTSTRVILDIFVQE